MGVVSKGDGPDGDASRDEAERGDRRDRVIYFLKEADILYRATDGASLPNEVLWPSGWRPLIGQLTISADSYPKPSIRGGPNNQADPLLFTQLESIAFEEAQQVARSRGLPTEGW